MGERHNILVISDLHLGEDLKGDGSMSVSALEEQLVAFVDHHRVEREDGRPWRLIINGDMVDFLSIVVMPEDAELSPAHAEDAVYGLGEDEAACVVKIGLVIGRHEALFSALARFIGAGHSLSVVVGNHDVGFHWPQVQAEVRGALQRCADRDRFRVLRRRGHRHRHRPQAEQGAEALRVMLSG